MIVNIDVERYSKLCIIAGIKNPVPAEFYKSRLLLKEYLKSRDITYVIDINSFYGYIKGEEKDINWILLQL